MRRLVALVALVIAGLLASPTSANAAPPTDAYKIIEANIGSGSECGGPEDCLAVLKDQVNTWQPHAVMGEEFCYSDYLELKAFLDAKNAGWTTIFSTLTYHKVPLTNDPDPVDQTNGLGCPDPDGSGYEAKGNVLAGLSLGTATEYVLTPVPAGCDTTNEYITCQQFALQCAVVNGLTGIDRPSSICVTHLAAGEDNALQKRSQLRQIQALQEGWSRPAIGGDFNYRGDAVEYQNFLDDTMNGSEAGLGNGAKKLVDPESAVKYVDHITYRAVAGLTTSSGIIDLPYSTHQLHRAWFSY